MRPMNNNFVLITGGSSGIGGALARRFAKAGSEVFVCGRRNEKVEEISKLPRITGLVCDISRKSERENLIKEVLTRFPKLNILINNAGIQVRGPKYQDSPSWDPISYEIETNFSAPIHLCMLLANHFTKQPKASIVNVTSGLALAPLALIPDYCATKAGLRSFTKSLRQQLKGTSTEVIEVVPPAVNSDLGGKDLHTFGVPLDEFADHVFNEIRQGKIEIGYGTSLKLLSASKNELDKIFQGMNNT